MKCWFVRGLAACSGLILFMPNCPALAQSLPATSAPTRADAETLLRNWQRTNLIEDTAFAPFTRIGSKSLPLFAPYLTDKDLGTFAEFAMQRIDSIAATPYLLAVLPRKDAQTQNNALRAANRALLEYGWYERAGKPKPNPGEPPSRYPRNTLPYPYTRQIYAVAVAMLKNKQETIPVPNALQTVGLTGSRRDIPLLREYVKHDAGPSFESGDRYPALAALARLGDKTTLDFIAAELSKPIQTKPAEPYGTDSGHIVPPKPRAAVTMPEDAKRFRGVAWLAAFSMNRRFIPLLMQHLDDPPGQFYGDYGDPSPTMEACQALGKIAAGTENLRTAEYWKNWWTQQNPK